MSVDLYVLPRRRFDDMVEEGGSGRCRSETELGYRGVRGASGRAARVGSCLGDRMVGRDPLSSSSPEGKVEDAQLGGRPPNDHLQSLTQVSFIHINRPILIPLTPNKPSDHPTTPSEQDDDDRDVSPQARRSAPPGLVQLPSAQPLSPPLLSLTRMWVTLCLVVSLVRARPTGPMTLRSLVSGTCSYELVCG